MRQGARDLSEFDGVVVVVVVVVVVDQGLHGNRLRPQNRLRDFSAPGS